ncbi:MAG: hypothetical protein M9899_08550 [Bdellovibrionaceae bacterium]|nr:hypothetical protein [Pseudobdellovibrionaceae bacterium]
MAKIINRKSARIFSALVICFTMIHIGHQAQAALAEFGSVTASSPSKGVFAVSDGSTFARYCLIELTVKDKTIHWISHPLEKDYVRREPSFIHNFNDEYLLIGTSAQKNKDESAAQVHLYHKPQQKLSLVAEATCEFPKKIEINKSEIQFDCAKAQKDKTVIGKDETGKLFAGLIKDKKLEISGKSYEAKTDDLTFSVEETDDYFKDRLQIKRGDSLLKEYEAKDFIRCFEYETIKGSQEKFSS